MKGYRTVDYEEPREEARATETSSPRQSWLGADEAPREETLTDSITLTQKKAGELLIKVLRDLGDPVDPRLTALVELPVKRTFRTPAQTVDEVKRACGGLRKMAESCPGGDMRTGMNAVLEVIESTLEGFM